MRVLALWVLAVTLTLGHAVPLRKGGRFVVQQTGQEVKPIQQETKQDNLQTGLGEQETPEDEDNLKDDPDWLPEYEDYEEEDYSSDGEDDVLDDYPVEVDEDDPKNIRLSYGVSDEDESDEVDENKLWLSDEDPDWVPDEEDSSDEDEDEAYQSAEDPDWVPDKEDLSYEDEDEAYQSAEDQDWVPDEEDLSDEDEDQVWLSDEDPDWVPDSDELTSTEDYQSTEDQTRLDDDLIQALAQAMLAKAGKGTLQDMIALIDELDLNQEEAQEALLGLQLKEDEALQQDQSETYRKRPLRGVKGQYVQEDQVGYLDQQDQLGDLQQQDQLGDFQQQGQLGDFQQQGQLGDLQQQDQLDQLNQVSQGGQYNAQEDLGQGVEPLQPGIPGRTDIGIGVEPVTEVADRPSFIGWLGEKWEDAKETFDDIGDRVEDKFDNARETISEVVHTAVDKVETAFEDAGDKITTTFNRLKERVAELKERLKIILHKFGVTVQLGAQYCFKMLTEKAHKIQGTLVFEKLEQALQDGNEQVSEFFTVLGQKISDWRQGQVGTDVDTGLVIDGSHQQQGQDLSQFEDQAMPEFFQDQQVQGELDKLVAQGFLTQEDLQVFSQQTQQQDQYGQERARRERKMRSWVDSLKELAY